MNYQALEIKLDVDESEKKSQSKKNNQEIFGDSFQVEDLSDPQKHLPQYQMQQYVEGSCVQDCNVCCGNICICLAYPFACFCCKCCCVHELSTSTAGLVEEFGKFKRMLTPGFNMINPCTEQIREVDLKIQLLTTGNNQCITKDNVKVTIVSSLAYRIVNPITANYVLGSQLRSALSQLTVSSVRNAVGQEILDVVLTNRLKIVEVARQLVVKGLPHGIFVERVFIEDISIPPQTLRDLSAAARQRRVSEANIINSQADVETASLMRTAAELLDTKAAMQIRYLEMVQQIGKKGCKLMMPIGVDKKGYKN